MRLIKEYHAWMTEKHRLPAERDCALRKIARCWGFRAVGGGFHSCCGRMWFYLRGRPDHVEVTLARWWQPKLVEGSVPTLSI